MLRLSDFFRPLNLTNLLYVLFLLVFFDVLGTLIKSFFVKKREVDLATRLANWPMGLGFFVFVWFILGFFVVPSQFNLQISILVLFCVSLPYYLKSKAYLSLFRLAKPLILPIILILPFLYPTFIKASLPPYLWDEMAYHFISPNILINNISQFWQFSGDLYGNLPRLMDTMYILSFSLTHTYSVIRLIQFLLLITSVFSVFLVIKKLLGGTSAALFILIFLSLPMKIPSLATVGYVDIAAMSFLFLGFIFGLIFLFSNTKDYLILSFIFWAMSIGAKYTTVTAFGAFAISFSVIYWIKNRSFAALFDRKTFLRVILGLVIFGGYWYIKNFIIYGNPIYPFLFPCWGKFAQNCGTGSSFFGTWTIPVNFYNFYGIIETLLPQNVVLRFAFVLSPFLITIFGGKKSKLILLMLILSFGIETFVLSRFSGFDSRYQQYLVFTLVFIIVLLVSSGFRLFTARLTQLVILVALFGSCTFFYLQNATFLYSFKYVNLSQINYALGKENISDWIKNILPEVSAATLWCDGRQDGQVNLEIFDPDMIWSTYNGLMRVYLVNCSYNPVILQSEDLEDFVNVARERKLEFWTVSANTCLPQSEVKARGGDGEELVSMRKVNNTIICNSTEVVPNLYYFNYVALKRNL